MSTIREGSVVFCLGEGTDLFRVIQVRGDGAYLSSSINGDGSGGWESLKKLELVESAEWITSKRKISLLSDCL